MQTNPSLDPDICQMTLTESWKLWPFDLYCSGFKLLEPRALIIIRQSNLPCILNSSYLLVLDRENCLQTIHVLIYKEIGEAGRIKVFGEAGRIKVFEFILNSVNDDNHSWL